jgi:hypothetical protein
MKNSHTAPLEVLSPRANGSFETEPFEAGWADEALAMVYVREVAGPSPQLELRAQLSVDGARWFDHPSEPLRVRRPGGYHLPLTQFGNWLRLSGHVSGGPEDGAPAFVVDLYWVLKG